MECAAQHPGNVGVYGRRRTLVGKAGDCASGITADAGEPPELNDVIRNDTTVISHYLACKPVQVGSPAVIAETFPAFSNSGG